MEAIAGVIAGFLLGVMADIVRQKLDKRRRAEERSERAAEELVALLDDVRAPFRAAYRRDSDVDDENVRIAVTKLRQKSLLLADPEARDRFELIAEILEHYFGAQEFTGDTPSAIAWAAWKEGREVLRFVLDMKAVGPPSAKILEYKASIDEGHQLWEERMEEEAKRRRDATD